MPPRELFLSHSSKDVAAAKMLAETLNRHGVPTFLAPANLLGAQQWQDEILSAILRCDWFAVLLSPNALESMWVRREIAMALIDPRFEQRIIPILYSDCDVDQLGWLRLFQMIDMRGKRRESAFRELLRIWGLAPK